MKKHVTHIVKLSLFLLVLLVLWAPVIQGNFEVVKPIRLQGYFTTYKNPTFSFKDWLSGNYQENEEKYLGHNFGFRNSLVKVYNETRYTLYKQFNSYKIYEGKDGYLFSCSYLGYHHSISDTFRANMTNNLILFKQVADFLDSTYGCKMILVAAPDKNLYLKEYLPDLLKNLGETPDYMELIQRKSDSLGINYLDLNQYFLNHADSFDYPVFAKGGIHWTKSAGYHAMDLVTKFMEQISGEDLTNLIYPKPEPKDYGIWEPDVDIFNSANLFRDWNEVELRYSELIPDSTGKKPKVLSVSDSYYHVASWSLIPKIYWDTTSMFWYYNNQCFDVDNNELEKADLHTAFTNTDFVLIMSSVENLRWFTFDFIFQVEDELMRD